MDDPADSPVAVVGLGKLGLPLACLLAAKGHPTFGIDRAQSVVDLVNAAAYRGAEPGVAHLLRSHRARLRASVDFHAIPHTLAAFVVVPTPSDADDTFSLRCVLPAVRDVARQVAGAGIRDYLLILVSTVMPGACDNELWPAILEVTGREDACGLELVYCPEFVALGDVVRGMLAPDLVLIGARCARAAERVAALYRNLVENAPAFVLTSLASSEVAKLGLNVMVSVKISCANLLAQVCERLPGSSADDVSRAVGADRRIGPSYLRGGLGYGGPCFPRDVRALAALCRSFAVDARLPEAVTGFNDGIPEKIAGIIYEQPPRGRSVGVLGLAYRPGTAITEGSQALAITSSLRRRGVAVCVHDPLVAEGDLLPFLREYGVRWCADLPGVFAAADKVVLATTAPEFRSFDPGLLRNRTLIDCWRHAAPEVIAWWQGGVIPGFTYKALGQHLQQAPKTRG